MNNRLFVVNKPIGMSSNFYLRKIKRKYKQKKAGFSGTLDPFAQGCLIVAFDQYTKLFNYLDKTPKSYRATLWLGVHSDSLDNENVTVLESNPEKVMLKDINDAILQLHAEVEYLPPKYSAKKIDGQRAYALARQGQDVAMKPITMQVYSMNLIHYRHPFITFEATVSEGSYIRSLAQLLVEKISSKGTLSSLRRLHEGRFIYDEQKALDPIEYLKIPRNTYLGDEQWISLGKKIEIQYLENKNDGEYLLVFKTFFSIIKILDEKVSYSLNKIQRDNNVQ
ncbi:MAG: tRNA pseudouridine(55) synthase TruB [Campylobacterota bacterium]|nr:tRNA pseudouridine(55) synthase TruB [Campylobacterota bacterium]